jgi:hypothetical protein
MNRKLGVSVAVLLFSLLCASTLANNVVLLSFFLLGLAYVKHKLYPIKRELLWFLMISLGGSMAEIVFVNMSNAWSYSNPQLYGIPLWIPWFWGVVGTTLIVAYDGLTNKSVGKK